MKRWKWMHRIFKRSLLYGNANLLYSHMHLSKYTLDKMRYVTHPRAYTVHIFQFRLCGKLQPYWFWKNFDIHFLIPVNARYNADRIFLSYYNHEIILCRFSQWNRQRNTFRFKDKSLLNPLKYHYFIIYSNNYIFSRIN